MKEYIMIYRQNDDGSTTPVFTPIQGMAVSDGKYNILITPIEQPVPQPEKIDDKREPTKVILEGNDQPPESA